MHPSVPVLVAVYKCYDINDTNPIGNDWWAGPGGSSGGGGGECTDCPPNEQNPPTEPCNGNGVATGPVDPNANIGEGGCEGIVTIPILPLTRPTSCEKLSNLLDPLKANLKPLITGGMYSYINNSSKGEAGLYLRKDTAGNITTEIVPPTDSLALPGKWGTSYYSMLHTHPKSAYPMFSYSDIMVMYNIEYQSYSYNRGHSSMLLVCEDGDGVKQTYAVVFENTGAPIENTLNNPNLIGKTQKEKLKALDGILNKMYDKELSKKTLDPSYNPNYERVFLQFCFGTNIGLYKADNNLINWSKLTISNNSDTATVTPTNCN